MKIFKFFLDIIAPKKCYSCNREGYFICEKCFISENNYKSACYVCKKNSKNFSICQECKKQINYDKIIILSHYNSEIVSLLIKEAKFYNKKEIFDDFSNFLYEKFLLNQKIKNIDDYLIVNIPSSFKRKIKRGKGSSEILSQNFSKLSGIKYQKNIIKKIKDTLQQATLSRKNRLINLKDAFIINNNKKDLILNKKIIILDDVISTGTTINEVSKVLKQNGAVEIIGLIIASG